MQSKASGAPKAGNINHRYQASERRINGRACVHCHERKTRCDLLEKGAPCTSCSSRNLPGCRLYPKKKHRQAAVRSRDPVPICPRGPGLRLPAEEQVNKVQEISPASARPASQAEESDGESDESALNFIHREDVRTRELNHQTRLCFVGTGISNCNYLIRESSPKPNEDGILHFCNRSMHRKRVPSARQLIPPDALELPEKRLADKLIRAYFDNVNVGWPIVDQEQFMVQYGGKDPGNPLPLALLNAVFLVGAHVLASQDNSMEGLQTIFFSRAKTLFDYRLEQDRVMYIQVALLMTWYSDGMEEIIANAWYWIGIATRTALGLGMHRDVSKCRMQAAHKRIYARLWWVVFQFDTIASASSGRPQALNIDDSDVPELEHSHFEGIPGAEADFVIYQTRLCQIISRTMREWCALNASPESRIQAVHKADSALARFLLELPQRLQLSVVNGDIWQSILHLTYSDFIIRLHRPPPRHNVRDQAFEACSDPSLCGGATMSICSILDSLLCQKKLSILWFYSNHVLFTAMIYVSNEVGSNNPIVAAKSRGHFQSLMLSLQDLSKHWKYAQSLLHLFEQRALRWKQKSTTQKAADSAASRPLQNNNTGVEYFTLRPEISSEEPNQAHNSLDSSYWAHSTGQLPNGLEPTPRGMTSTNISAVSYADPEGGFSGYDDDFTIEDLSFLDPFAYDFFLGEMDSQS